MTLCSASSVKNAMRSLGFIVVLFALVAAVIVCSAGLYEGGNDDMIIVLKRESDSVDPILIRLSRHLNISSK